MMSAQFDDEFWKIVPFVTSVMALLVVYANARFGLRNKQADLIIHFHKQFDEIQKKRGELLVAQAEVAAKISGSWSAQRIEVEAGIFFDRFWSLQFDQFLAWYEGYVPTSLYIYWVFSRWRELHQPSAGWTFCGKTLASTLDDLKIHWKNNPDQSSKQSAHLTSFLGIMFKLKHNGATIGVDEELRNHGPSPLRQFARWLFGAY